MASTAPTSASKDANSVPDGVPDFVVKHAPLVYMYSKEKYMPSDIGAQLVHTVPKINAADLPASANSLLSSLTLGNLDQLNQYGNGGTDLYLTSKDDISKDPAWFFGVKPGSDGKVPNAKTCAVIVADKGNGTVDAFFVYFYAYNWGGKVFDDNLGNHVGDWEHNMVRFINGVPKYVWYSQHASGQAYTFEAVEKDKAGLRPVSYSANGSHANYSTDGVHDHTIPSLHHPTPGLLNDYTDHGALYDPAQSAYWYKWVPPPPAAKPAPAPAPGNPPQAPLDNVSKRGTFTAYDPSHPVNWLYFEGHWGDKRLPEHDKRQSNLFDAFWRYDNGPTGPADKDIARTNVWSGSNHFILNHRAS